MGLGKAVVCEALNRCAKLGAKSACVISNQEFYKKLGFSPYCYYTFHWKKAKIPLRRVLLVTLRHGVKWVA